METQVQKPVLVTLTGPTASGKSFLFNYIRDVAKLPCLISTTTRAPRAGEQEGIDYYFISEEESLRLEREGLLAELAVYNGVRYGVTKVEFAAKLSQGIAFLIVEPGGIDHYVQPALDIGAASFKMYVHTDPQVRMERFRARAELDMMTSQAFGKTYHSMTNQTMKIFNTYMDRLTTMLTEEMKWYQAHPWNRVLFGEESPKVNLKIILEDIAAFHDHMKELNDSRKSQH